MGSGSQLVLTRGRSVAPNSFARASRTLHDVSRLTLSAMEWSVPLHAGNNSFHFGPHTPGLLIEQHNQSTMEPYLVSILCFQGEGILSSPDLEGCSRSDTCVTVQPEQET